MKQYKGNVKWTEAKWLKFTEKVNEAIELLENVGSCGNKLVSPRGTPAVIQSVIFAISSIDKIFSYAKR